jgi:hypothetical protein
MMACPVVNSKTETLTSHPITAEAGSDETTFIVKLATNFPAVGDSPASESMSGRSF